MADTKIEWANKTWNPTRGCSLVSDGCKHCYAMRQAHRFNTAGGPYEGLTVLTSTGPKWNGDITLVPDKLGEPMRWRNPCRIFVNSMSDVFHEGVDDSFIDRIFGVIQLCPQHIFQILTKRPQRMMEYMNEPGRGGKVMLAAEREAFDQDTLAQRHGRLPATAKYDKTADITAGESLIKVKGGTWPPPNAWMGTSVENQKTADERIPFLLRTLAMVRWISAEPLLGMIDLREAHVTKQRLANWPNPTRVDWVVVGGESGPGARPMDPEWARSLRDQCVSRNIAYFFKQYGDWAVGGKVEKDDSYAGGYAFDSLFGGRVSTQCVRNRGRNTRALEGNRVIERVGKHKAGRLLDGREWNQYPR